MNAQKNEPSASKLSYRDVLPLRWSVLRAKPDAALTAQWMRVNEQVLQAASLFDEHRTLIVDEQSTTGQELARTNAKLDLLLDLLSDVITSHLELPVPVPVEFSVTSATWTSEHVPSANSLVQLEIFITDKFPRPLSFLGTVTSVAPVRGGARAQVEFQALAGKIQEELEKLIFRHHRRAVAQGKNTVGRER